MAPRKIIGTIFVRGSTVLIILDDVYNYTGSSATADTNCDSPASNDSEGEVLPAITVKEDYVSNNTDGKEDDNTEGDAKTEQKSTADGVKDTGSEGKGSSEEEVKTEGKESEGVKDSEGTKPKTEEGRYSRKYIF